jgi:hypothetical protein
MNLSREPGALLSFTPAQAVRQTRPCDREQFANMYYAVYWRMYHDDDADAALLKPYADAFDPYRTRYD